MLVVVAIVAVLMVFGMPAVRTMLNSFHSDGNTRAMINSALAAARSIAVSEQTYAGVRFQFAYNPRNGGDILAMPQYLIIIIHDADGTGLEWGFRAAEGIEPVKLPESVGVMDLKVRANSSDATKSLPDDVVTNTHIDDADGLRNATTFSIVFSPAGKLVVQDVRTRNRDGETGISTVSHDDIFNTRQNVENHVTGMFYQDDDTTLGLGQEMSRNSFIIFDTNILKRTDTNWRWRDYLSTLQPVHINPYTGAIINNK